MPFKPWVVGASPARPAMNQKELVQSMKKAKLLFISEKRNYFYWNCKKFLLLGDSKAIEEFEKAVESFPQGLPMQYI